MCLRLLIAGLFLVAPIAQPAGQCQLPEQHYRVGTEALDFFPHYNFSGEGVAGYGNQVLERFAEFAGIELTFKALPVKRLYHEIDRMVDAVYPDHPRWVQYQGVAPDRAFSLPVATAVGIAWSRASTPELETSQVRSLAIIHGFTPIAWFGIRDRYPFRIIEVPDAKTALRLLLSGRVDAVDLEYNVARYQFQQMEAMTGAVVAERLPYTLGQYHLSSANRPELIRCFDQFLKQHQQELAELKATFGLIETLPFVQNTSQDLQ